MKTLIELRVFRFALVGGLVAVIYVSLYLAFLQLGLSRTLANGAAFGLAVVTQYLGQTLFTFRRSLSEAGQIARFATMIGFGFLTSALVTGWIGPAASAPEWAAAAAVAVILPVQNYLLMRLWVYAEALEVTEN